MTATARRTDLAAGIALRVHDTFEEASRDAAAMVASVVRTDPRAVLGVATGSTPSLLYSALADRVAAGELDLGSASAFALDEYVGLEQSHPESYRSVIEREVRLPLRMDPSLVHVPDGSADDLERAAAGYDAAIRAAGGVELQILGIGGNGHIGFNEPGTPFDVRTHAVDLEPSTREANARFFDGVVDRVPSRALTQGIGTILEARSIVLLASGEVKAEAIAAALLGPIDPACPGSALQLHPRVTVLLDRDAARGLER